MNRNKVGIGATVIEKTSPCPAAFPPPDSAFSLEPHEFKEVDAIRTTEKALGEVSYEITEKQKESRVFRRSLFVVKDIREGEKFTRENVCSIRPGYGLHTRYLDQIIGRKAKVFIKKGTPLDWGLVG